MQKKMVIIRVFCFKVLFKIKLSFYQSISKNSLSTWEGLSPMVVTKRYRRIKK